MSIRKLTCCYLLGAFAFVYLEVSILPHTPLLAYGDQAIYLLDGTRMLQGQVIYRDFFHFAFPGTTVIYAVLFKCFGIRAWIPQAMLIVLGASLAGLGAVISKRLVRGPAAFLPGLLFLTLAFRNALDATHHWYSVLAVISALAVTIESRSPARLAAAGALCGLATWFTQSHGLAAVLGFGLFLWWEGRRRSQARPGLIRAEAWLFGSFLGALAALDAYFIWKAGLNRFWFCTVVFVLKFYPADWANTWRVYLTELPRLHAWSDLPGWGSFLFIHVLLPLVYVLFFVRYRRVSAISPREPWDRLMLVNVVGLSLFASVAPSPSYLRLCSVCLPALIVLVWLVRQPGRLERLMFASLWLMALVLVIAGPAARQRHWRAYLDLPTGRTAFLDPNLYGEYRWVFERTRPREFFFGDQLITFALGLRDPAPVDFIRPTDYTRPKQVGSVVEALEREKVRYLLWYLGLDLQPNRAGDHLGPLRAYLRSHYHVVKTFAGGDLAWERNCQTFGTEEPAVPPPWSQQKPGKSAHYCQSGNRNLVH